MHSRNLIKRRHRIHRFQRQEGNAPIRRGDREEARQGHEERYRTLLEPLPIGVYRTTPDGRFIEANPAMARLFGLEDVATLKQCNVHDFYVDVTERDRHLASLSRGERGTPVLQLRRPDGATIWVKDFPRAYYDEEGNVLYYDGVLVDITEQKKGENELIAAREKAEELSRLKSTFLNNVSHEIRTPLTAIIGFSTILSDETAPEHKELIELIEQSGKRLLKTLNTVLDLSMLEAGGVSLENEWFDIVEALEERVSEAQPFAREKGLTLDCLAPMPRLLVHLDRTCLDRILTHLIDNAIKFTHHGNVTVRVGAEGNRVHIQVEDTGVGIDESFQPQLFDDFRQESSGLDRDHVGVGLGLAVTQRMVALMGGEIKVQSEKGRGSIFEVAFTQPVTGDSFARPIAPPTVTPRRYHLLVVEDAPEIEMLVEYMLQDTYTVTTTRHEEGALRLAHEQPFDLVLMDINLGSARTGVDVMKALRRLPAYKDVPIVAMTAYALLEDRTRFLDAGFDGYLSKPFSAAQAYHVIVPLLAAYHAS